MFFILIKSDQIRAISHFSERGGLVHKNLSLNKTSVRKSAQAVREVSI